MRRQVKQLSERDSKLSRREFLLKAAEAAVLALFGSMSLTKIAHAVEEHLRERRAIGALGDRIASYIQQNQIVTPMGCNQGYSCRPRGAVNCEDYECSRFICGRKYRDFNCGSWFTCGAFVCSPRGDRFDCENGPASFTCVRYTGIVPTEGGVKK